MDKTMEEKVAADYFVLCSDSENPTSIYKWFSEKRKDDLSDASDSMPQNLNQNLNSKSKARSGDFESKSVSDTKKRKAATDNTSYTIEQLEILIQNLRLNSKNCRTS